MALAPASCTEHPISARDVENQAVGGGPYCLPEGGDCLEFRIKETSRCEAFLAYPATVVIHP